MDNPTEEITGVVHKLCQGSPAEQTEAINAYFTPNASFTHPFCRTGSFEGSRNLIHAIYKWYKLLSPKIELKVNSVAYDSANMILYLNITQLFSLWFVPFHHANVTLTTELHLTRPPNSQRYYITAQNDLYQNDQLLRFMAPFGVAELFVHLWQYSSTLMCLLGAFLLAPATKLQQNWAERTEANGPIDVEEEIRGLVSSAMEGVGYKQPEARKRRSSNSDTTSAKPDAGSSAAAGASSTSGADAGPDANGRHGVQRFGNMHVVT
ncbi:hypothetical protein MBLNU13_g00649t2 [Cladosporium sp. NU13]